jgi:hypothetical protein
MRKIISVIAVTLLLASCVNSYKQNYRPFVNTEANTNLELLTEGATPIVNKSTNVSQDVANAKAQGYIVVGESTFNGELQPIDNLINQAKAVKATMVIYSANYTDTETVTSTSYVPVDTTTYSAGRYGGRNYDDVSTTSGLVPVPTVSQVRNFDQHAVFLVKARH